MVGEEVILAEERDVILKSKQSDGTLVLTNKRILFLPATQEQDIGYIGFSNAPNLGVYYTDIKDLKDISDARGDFISIELPSITEEKGRKGFLHPSLKVKWKREDMTTSEEEFLQRFVGKSKRINLTDWAVAIERIRNSSNFYPKLPDYSSVSQDVLAQTIIKVLSDLQEKGLYEIEQEIETAYQLDQEIDADELKSKCQSLVEKGILSVDATGEFYWIRSPIEDIDSSRGTSRSA